MRCWFTTIEIAVKIILYIVYAALMNTVM